MANFSKFAPLKFLRKTLWPCLFLDFFAKQFPNCIYLHCETLLWMIRLSAFWALEFVCPNQNTGLPNNLNLSLVKTLLPNLKSDVTSKDINYINNNKQISEHQQKTFVMLNRFFAVKWVGVWMNPLTQENLWQIFFFHIIVNEVLKIYEKWYVKQEMEKLVAISCKFL